MRAVIAWLVLAAPVASATALLACAVVSEGAGRVPAGGAVALNSAEAAALGDAATTLRLIRLGDDPNRVHPVRPWIISASVQRATTLEAAPWSRREAMIRALDREGAIVGTDSRHNLSCLARDLDLPGIVEYLAPTGGDCVPGTAIEAVMARTRGAGAAAHD